MLIIAMIVVAALLLWIAVSAHSVAINTGVAATQAMKLSERLESLETQVGELARTVHTLDHLAAILAYSASQHLALEPNYLTEKDLSADEQRLRVQARVALKSLSNR